MAIISELPDDLLLKILSLLPTKTVFEAQVMCRKWQNLWRKLSSLNFDRASHNSDEKFLEFINRTMKSYESPVLESLHLRLSPAESSYRVRLMNDLVKQRLRNLEVVGTTPDRSVLAKDIYQFHTLLVLRLQSSSLEDFYGVPISLLSLTVLELTHVKYPSDETLSYLLSSLPSLQDLTLSRCLSVKTPTTLAITVPCLKRLTFVRFRDDRLMILDVNTPCLNYLRIEEYSKTVSFVYPKMEKLIEAKVVTFSYTKELLKALISAKRLYLCLGTSKIPQGNVIFDQLVSLEICTCQKEWWFLLERVLLDSPKLRFLKLHRKPCLRIRFPEVRFEILTSVPQCFVSHLETFEWRGYEGSPQEKNLASFIFRNARRLTTATIYLRPQVNPNISSELIAMPKASTSCVLVFQQINDP